MNYSDINNAGEFDINEITKRVFSEEVKPPKSIQLLFDNITLKEVFEVLLTFTVNGMKHKFSQDEFNTNIFPWFVEFNNYPYDEKETDLTKYQYLITKDKYYVISFNFIS